MAGSAESPTPATGQLRFLALAAAVVGADQWSKALLERSLQLAESRQVLPVFNIVRAHNRGVAFSMFAAAAGWQRWVFSLLAVGVSTVLVVWLRRLEREAKLVAAALALVLGGALGNVIDRLRLGYVVDFIQVHWQEHYFPAFNIADSAITVGAGLLLLDAALGSRRAARG
jgi:signal peptidase II